MFTSRQHTSGQNYSIKVHKKQFENSRSYYGQMKFGKSPLKFNSGSFCLPVCYPEAKILKFAEL